MLNRFMTLGDLCIFPQLKWIMKKISSDVLPSQSCTSGCNLYFSQKINQLKEISSDTDRVSLLCLQGPRALVFGHVP